MTERLTDSTVVSHLAATSPVLALLSLADGLCAGGAGGVAIGRGTDWRPKAGFGAAALARLSDGVVIIGGPEGLARLDGDALERSEISGGTYPVAALASAGTTALAGTLGGGVVRSEDSGRTWQPVTFGLASDEVTSLAWLTGETVLAGTAAGIHRSPNGGRAWRVAAGTEDCCVAAIAFAAGQAIAVGEDGAVLGSLDEGRTWDHRGSLPTGAIPVSIHLGPDGQLLAGTAVHGILRSVDGGSHWERTYDDVAFAFVDVSDAIVAGLGGGLARSRDGGRTWQPAGVPPVHDLAHLLMVGAELFAWGATAGLHRVGGESAQPLVDAPVPLTAVEPSPAGGLTAATPEGLWRLTSDGRIEESSRVGAVHLVAYDPAGAGWAAARDGSLLLRSGDGGQTWSTVESPWGTTEVIALRVLPSGPVAATYDRTRSVVDLWRADADGWAHCARAQLATPAVAICADPPAAVLGQTWQVEDGTGRWRGGSGPAGMICRVRGRGDRVLALTDSQLAYSSDRGRTWTPQSLPVPIGDVLDVELAAETIYVLLAGGRLLRLDP